MILIDPPLAHEPQCYHRLLDCQRGSNLCSNKNNGRFLFLWKTCSNNLSSSIHPWRFEDDMSRALGWALSHCPGLLKTFVSKVAGGDFDPSAATVKFQVIDRKTGPIDLEIESRESVHLVGEAKRGSELPTQAQLTQYAIRLTSSQAAEKAIVVLTDCSPSYAKAISAL